jgi:hypothetical protein
VIARIRGDLPPTLTLLGVATLALPEMLFEVDAVAVRPSRLQPPRPVFGAQLFRISVGSFTTLTKKWSICLIASMKPSKSTGFVT